MTKRIQLIAFTACMARLLPIGMVLFFSMPTAQATQCSVALPSNPHEHWSYQIIDGRKCWYEGSPMLSKSLLRWPAQARALPNSDAGPVSVLTEKPDNFFDPDACCWPPLNNSDTTDAFAQGASPKAKRATVGTQPLVQIKPSAPAGCKLVGTVKGTKLWAGDCIPNEMRSGSTVPETDAPTPPSSPSPDKE